MAQPNGLKGVGWWARMLKWHRDSGKPGFKLGRRGQWRLLGVGTRGLVFGGVQYCIDFGVLEDICLHRVCGWS